MSDTAAAARAAYLGTDVIQWDELKPEIRERWARVVDVAQKPIYAELEVARKELECIKAERDALRVGWNNSHKAEDALEAALAPIRVPFSDAVIERMAAAACDSIGYTLLYENSTQPARDQWQKGIRAALAAGGIEPCAVPQYAPEEVAFRAERASDEELVHIAIREYGAERQPETTTWQRTAAAVRSRVEAPLLVEIARLEQEAKANIEWQETMVLEMRNKDAQLAAVTAERDAMCHQQTKRCMSWRRCFNLAFRLKNKYRAELAALRQPVDATPTDAQVEALARAIHVGCSGLLFEEIRSYRMEQARAAYAHIGRGPVDECKECAKRPKNVVTSFNFTFNYDTGTWQVVNRAALEGE